MWTKEEQKEHRKEWVRALRSGKYRQTRGALKDSFGYCCLGVGCEVSKLGEFIKYENFDTERFVLLGDPAEYRIDFPEEVRDYYGLADSAGKIAKFVSLLGYNDHGHTFKQIADIIEQEPSGLVI